MASSWIKMRVSLTTDPRVFALSAATKTHPAHVIGALHWLWSQADMHTTSGKLYGYSVSQVDGAVGIHGFCEAMTKLTREGKARPWLAIGDGFLQVLHFQDHNGSTAKGRATAALRQSRLRHAKDATKSAPRERVRERERLPEGTHTAGAGEISERAPVHRPRLSPELTPIFAAYPAHRRTGKMAALKAIGRALDTLEARGQENPGAWLLARVEAFARSWQGQSAVCWQAARWFDDGHYDDEDVAWQEASDGRHGGGGGAGGGSASGGASRIELNHARRTHGQYPESLDIPE